MKLVFSRLLRVGKRLESSLSVLAVIPLAALLLGVIIQLTCGHFLSRRAKGWLAFICCLVGFAAIMTMIPTISSGKVIDVTLFSWDKKPSLSVSHRRVEYYLALIATGIGAPFCYTA